jgi:hypothetical protein
MIRTFIKFLTPLCLATAVNGSLGFGANDGLRFGLDFRPAEGQIFPGYLQQISSVPVSARLVPIHSGDPGAGTLALIPVD